jgi:hypothetical protein
MQLSRDGIRIGPAWAAALLAMALLLAPSLLRGGSAAAAANYTRSTSCHGLNWTPMESGTTSNYDNLMRIRVGTEGYGFFGCDPKLPTGATVKKVQFTVYDADNHTEVRYCGLFRSTLDLSGYPGEPTAEQIAQVSSTGFEEHTGYSRKSTRAITFGSIDNTRWGYWFQCQINHDQYGAPANGGIVGASVTYTISAANG